MKEISREDFLKIIYVPDDFSIFNDIEKEYLIFNYLDNFSISKKNKTNGYFSNEQYIISDEQRKHKKNAKAYIEEKNFIEAYFELVYYFQCFNNNFKKIIYLSEVLEISNLVNDFKFNLYNNIYNKIDINALVSKFSSQSNITIYIEDFLSLPKTKIEKAIIFENNYLKVKINDDLYEFNNQEATTDFKKLIVSYAEELLFYSKEQSNSNNPNMHKKMLKEGYIDCIAGNIDGLQFNINSNCLDEKLINFSKMFRKEVWSFIKNLKIKLIDGNENNVVKEILKDVCLKLTGDIKTDYSYLNQAIDDYKEHKLYTKILIAINNKIYQLLKSYAHKNIDKINEQLDLAIDCIFGEKKNLDEGIKVLSNIINENMMYEYFELYNLVSFDSDLDYYFYSSIYGDNKQLKRIAIPFSKIYYLLTYAYNELGKHDEALTMANKSLKWNPINVDVYSEMFYIYKTKLDEDNINRLIDEIHKQIYKPEDLSYYYKLLGNYFVNANVDLAYALYYLAYKYYEDDELLESMVKINDTLNRGVYKLNDIDIKTTLEKNHIPYGPDEKNVQMLFYIYANNKRLIRNPKADALLSNIIYKYTGDEKYAPLNKIIDKKTGIKTLYPRSWKYINDKNIFSFYTDNDALIQVGYSRICTKDQYNNIVMENVNSTLNDQELKFELLSRTGFTSSTLEKDFIYQTIVLKSYTLDKSKAIVNLFLVANNCFIVCSVDLKYEYNDYSWKKIEKDDNVLDLMKIAHYIVISNK